MYIPRIYDDLNNYLATDKALIIFGARQIGKTTMLAKFLATTNLRYRLETGDNILAQAMLSTPNLKELQEFLHGYELLVVDEAQKIHNIGVTLKLIIDQIPAVKIIATGSSSFELAGQVGEPLTGRKITLNFFPVSMLELRAQYNDYELKQQLDDFLIYGCYPEILTATSTASKRELITEITHSYLLKDILALDKIKNSKIILDLLRLLALQIGKEVSLNELATNLGIDSKTVARYLDLLEKSFVIYNLRGYSRNLRKEITKKSKYYFYDVGIRNAIIANFNPGNMRNDVGELWENFIIIERLKKQAYTHIYANNYFWRTWDQHEVDFVEERDGKLHGYEIKLSNKRVAAPKDWLGTYAEATFSVINKDNFLDFVATTSSD